MGFTHFCVNLTRSQVDFTFNKPVSSSKSRGICELGLPIGLTQIQVKLVNPFSLFLYDIVYIFRLGSTRAEFLRIAFLKSYLMKLKNDSTLIMKMYLIVVKQTNEQIGKIL